MSESPITTYPTAGGSLVVVVTVTPDRVKSMDDIAAQSGPVWRCSGCLAGSDKPLNNPVFGDPVRIVSAAAAGHAANCRS